MSSILHITPYLQLHPARITDAAELYALIDNNRNYLRKWLPFIDVTTAVTDSEAYLSMVEEQAERNPVYVIRLYGRLVGLAGFKDTDFDNLRTEIGYWLAENVQHKGIMTSSVRTLVDFAFADMGMHRIQIRVAEGNTSSRNIPLRLGFVKEGVERDGEQLEPGRFVNLEVFSLINAAQYSSHT
jgi:ribosomal-protein-serine acetyltransferase